MADHTNRVAAVVIPRTPEKEEYLVAKRAENSKWEFPGGKEDLEKDESIFDTAEREIREELNLDIEAIKQREESSYKSGGYDIVPVYAQHSYSNPDKHIELEDHTEYKWIDPENPKIKLGKETKCLEAFNSMNYKIEVAKVLVENNEGKFLILQKSDKYDWKAGKWELPGGKIEEDLGENRLDTAKREIKDEVGLKLKSLVDVVRVELEEFKKDKPVVDCWILYSDSFSAEVQLSKEHQEYSWVDPEEFKKMDWHRDAGYAIPAIERLKEYLD